MCVCVCVCVCVRVCNVFAVGPKREKSKYFKMNRSTNRSFKKIFVSFLRTCMFTACCFRQRTYVTQGHVILAPNETRIEIYIHIYIYVCVCVCVCV